MSQAPDSVLSVQKMDWSDWAIYVVSTIKTLVEKAEKQEREFFEIQETFLRDLQKLRQELKQDIVNCQNNEKKSLSRTLKEVDRMIEAVAERTATLEKMKPAELLVTTKIAELKETVIVPLRIRQAVLSASMGGAGGILTILLVDLIKGIFSGGAS